MAPRLTKQWFSAGDLVRMRLPGLPTTKPNMLAAAKRWAWETQFGGSKCRKRAKRGGGVEFHCSLLLEPARAVVIERFSRPVKARCSNAPTLLFRSLLKRPEFAAFQERGFALCDEMLAAVDGEPQC